ncbi:hypothetical protein GUJ93_ZPchr0009g1275 [Zizania palustris]|uniref:Uncharacterized protein n=1 Tax=Zizania palustris TaxID=103762 RepID=A0A8J5V458_ZIZPA|nr:hypothetical protein GUJ93_ZPchr0009g1275 [Zizania palustris]
MKVPEFVCIPSACICYCQTPLLLNFSYGTLCGSLANDRTRVCGGHGE